MKKYYLLFIPLILNLHNDLYSQYKGGSYDGYYSVLETNIIVGIENISEEVSDYKLFQNYPNPFNPETNIKFSLSENSNVSVKIYDINGRLVRTLVNNVKLNPGQYSVTFEAGNLSSGVYFYKLETDIFTDTKKMILSK